MINLNKVNFNHKDTAILGTKTDLKIVVAKNELHDKKDFLFGF